MIAQFITMTYDTRHVGITQNGFMTLVKTDVQKFMKRVRKRENSDKSLIKYFVVGEYGGQTMRPHYHMIVFNAKLEWLSSSWDKGQMHFGEVTGASIGYCLKYMMKKGKIPMHLNDDRQPEFRLMSKGLGANYLTRSMIAWHKADTENRMYVNVGDGKKATMPRYYKNKIWSDGEREIAKPLLRIRAEAQEVALQLHMIKTYGDNWKEKRREFILKRDQKFKIQQQKRDKL